MAARKEEIITFKADHELAEELRKIPNRSLFIRQALLRALDGACPLCGGSGVLTSKQMEHWNEILASHHISVCSTCREAHLVCELEPCD